MNALELKLKLLGRTYREGEGGSGGGEGGGGEGGGTGNAGPHGGANSGTGGGEGAGTGAGPAGEGGGGVAVGGFSTGENSDNQSQAETNRLGLNAEHSASDGPAMGTVGSQNTGPTLSSIPAAIAVPMAIAMPALAPALFGINTAIGTINDANDSTKSTSDMIGSLLGRIGTSIIGGQINSAIGKEVGPAAATGLAEAGQAASLSNAFAGTSMPTSVGGIITGAIKDGFNSPGNSGNTSGAAGGHGNMDSIQVGGFAAPKPTQTTASPQPTTPASQFAEANGDMGDITSYFNAGRGTLKRIGA